MRLTGLIPTGNYLPHFFASPQLKSSGTGLHSQSAAQIIFAKFLIRPTFFSIRIQALPPVASQTPLSIFALPSFMHYSPLALRELWVSISTSALFLRGTDSPRSCQCFRVPHSHYAVVRMSLLQLRCFSSRETFFASKRFTTTIARFLDAIRHPEHIFGARIRWPSS